MDRCILYLKLVKFVNDVNFSKFLCLELEYTFTKEIYNVCNF